MLYLHNEYITFIYMFNYHLLNISIQKSAAYQN